MPLLRTLAMLVLASPLLSMAQAQGFAGKWTGTMQGMGRGQLSVDVMLTDAGGTWRFTSGPNNNNCIRREFPVTIVSQSATGLVFEVDGAQVLSGCLKDTVTLKVEG